jgi:hypothetical protein
MEVVDKAQEALSQAKRAHEERAVAIEAERVALEKGGARPHARVQSGSVFYEVCVISAPVLRVSAT